MSDLLDLSSLEAGKLELVEGVFEPKAVVAQLCRVFELRARENGLDFSVEIEPPLPDYLYGDPARWSQMLMHFLTNAFKFTAEGEVALFIAGGPVDEEGFQLRCAVSDTGPGIPTEQLDRLFLPFSQIDSSLTRKHGGNGLGLSIVKRLAERMNGTVGVENHDGRGTTFWFTIVMKGTEGPELAQIGTPADGTAPLKRLAKVLLAEDNPINRRILTLQLEGCGYTVASAENGQVALDLLEQSSYDILILDCQMPVLDGYETARRVRSLPDQRRDMPILALTAHAFEGERERCLEAGMEEFLTKPVSAKELDRIIQLTLDRRAD